MSTPSIETNTPHSTEVPVAITAGNPADILDAAYADGRQTEIVKAHELVRQAMAPVQPTQPKVEVLPPQQAPQTREFTGAARRVTLTGGRLPDNGGYHSSQPLFR
jgi:hypothetical protein